MEPAPEAVADAEAEDAQVVASDVTYVDGTYEASAAGIGGDGFRIYEMTPVSPEGEFHDHGFVLEEYTIDTHQVLWLFLVIFFLPAAVGLVYYVKRFLMDERASG